MQIQSETLELTKSKMQDRITEEYFNNEIQIKRQELRTLETKQQALQSQNATLAMSAERMKIIKSLAKNNALLETFDPDILKSLLKSIKVIDETHLELEFKNGYRLLESIGESDSKA